MPKKTLSKQEKALLAKEKSKTSTTGNNLKLEDSKKQSVVNDKTKNSIKK